MHAIELGSEVAQSLFSHLEVEVYSRSKQKGNFVVKIGQSKFNGRVHS